MPIARRRTDGTVGACVGREDDDRKLRLLFLQCSQDRGAVSVRQAQIQQDGIVLMLMRLRERFCTGAGDVYLIAVVVE